MISVTKRQSQFASVMTDVLVYTVVLNLFVEYSDAIVIDSFTISVFTAALLKVLLEIIFAAEHAVSEYFEKRERPLSKVLQVVSVWLILFSSKFLILEVVDFVFGEHVELGGFWDVILLVIALIVAQKVVGLIYDSLGTRDDAAKPA